MVGSPTGGFVAAGGAYGAATLLFSQNGTTWKALKAPPKSSGLRSVHVEPDGAITVVGEFGLHTRTQNLGKTWKRLATLDTDDCVFGLDTSPDGDRYLVADNGHVYLSSDAAKSVSAGLISRAPRLFRTRFVAGPNGWRPVFLGGDGALHWWHAGKARRQKLGSLPLTQLITLSTGTLLVTGDEGSLFRSVDAGKTFKRVKSGTTHALEDGCEALGGAVLVGNRGTVLFSVDDGKTFKKVAQRATNGGLWSVLLVDDRVLIGGDQGEVLELRKERRD